MNFQEGSRRGRNLLRGFGATVVLSLLAACGGSEFAYMDEGGGKSLTIVREQSYFHGPWHTTLVSAAMSRCAQRHPLPAITGDSFQVHVFRPEPGVYILKSGTQWFVTELQTCNFQTYKAPPPFPGEAVGRFEAGAGRIEYIPEKSAKR